jgi:hypothetical protein
MISGTVREPNDYYGYNSNGISNKKKSRGMRRT